jgi:hypothetical protein
VRRAGAGTEGSLRSELPFTSIDFHITGTSHLTFDPDDPLREGFRL